MVTRMAGGYRSALKIIKSVPGLGALASRMQFLLPDRVVVRDVEGLGPFAFRLRRHRWMLGDQPFAGGHHASTLAMFRQLIRPGDVVYDIGANIGYYSRFIARDLGASRLVCFEPMTENADLLEQNIRLGKHEGIARVFRLALSDHDGDELLQVDDVMGGTAVLNEVSGGKPSEAREHLGLGPKTQTIKVARLDSLIEREKLPPPGMMKIDTEGAEALVLGGAVETLRTHRPRLAVALHGLEPTAKVLTLLDSLGYVCRGSVNNIERDISSADALRLSDNNIVAIPK
jgi:FkbM family methyltransferase